MTQQLHGLKADRTVAQVGNRKDSNVYIRHQSRAVEEVGIEGYRIRLDSSTTETQMTSLLPSLFS